MSRILLSALVAAAAIASLMAPGCDRASSSNKGETAKPAATTTPAAAPDEAAPDEAAPEAPAEPDGTAQPAAASSARERACPDLADPRYALDPHAVCTEMDCPDGFHLNVTNVPYNGPGWPHGTYTYTITADGEEVTCTGSLPLDCDVRPCSARTTASWSSASAAPSRPTARPSVASTSRRTTRRA